MNQVEKNFINTEAEQLMRRAENIAESIIEMELIDTDEAYLRLKQKLKEQRRKRIIGRLTRYAAMFTLPLLMVCTALVYQASRRSDAQEAFTEVKALDGSVARHELPDGSVVWLNSGSVLRYAAGFGRGGRRVQLDGEAYFQVTADTENPFYVHTSAGVEAYVHGTRFNMSAYDGSEYVETVLEEGRVNVSLPNGEPEIELRPGECAVYHKAGKTGIKKPADIEEKTAWKHGELIFRDAGVEEIFHRLERHFNVRIICNKHTDKNYRYRATFRDETLPQILDYLSKSASMKWKTTGMPDSSGDKDARKTIVIDLY